MLVMQSVCLIIIYQSVCLSVNQSVCLSLCLIIIYLSVCTGGLWACQKLQSLTADGNLIINSVVSVSLSIYSALPISSSPLQGVESLHCLQHLSLAENHLPKLVGVVNCPLLQHVDVRQNNLQQVSVATQLVHNLHGTHF